ncbi:MAG: DNA polymerase III subunit delta [Acidobacteriota bacterium]
MKRLPLARLLTSVRKDAAVPPLLLIAGDSGFLVERAIQALAGLIPEEERSFGLWRGSAQDADPVRLLEEASTLPMWGSRRVILVRQAEKLQVERHPGWQRYFHQPSASTILAFAATPGVDSRKLKHLAQACTLVECRTPYAGEIPAWVMAEAQALGCSLDRDTASWMVELVGRDLAALYSWLERCLAYRGEPGKLTREDLEAVSGRRSPANLFAWADRVGEGNLGEALRLARRAVEDGEDPLPLLYRATNHLRRLARLRASTGGGGSPADAARRAGVPGFLAQKMAAQSRSRGDSELAEALAACARADRAIKSVRVSPARVLDRWLMEIRAGGKA